MNYKCFLSNLMLLLLLFSGGCDNVGDNEEEEFSVSGDGVFILNEGNFNAGNATLSYYDPVTKEVENGVFYRANDRKLGDTGQSVIIYDGTAYIAVENSGIVWGIDINTFKVQGQLETEGTKMINPRFVHIVNENKAYVTDLYSPYVNIFNPKTFKYIGAIPTKQPSNRGYSSTEEMVQYGKYVFTNCWSYSNKILVIDTEKDEVCDSITLSSWQPKSMKIDKYGKLWVITDGGYATSEDVYGDNIPYLYKIDATTRRIEQEQALDTDEANVQIALNGGRDTLYLINNDVYRMSVTDAHLPVRPFITAEIDANGKKHKLYGLNVNPVNSDIYVADAVDYSQSGVVYRYSSQGVLIDKFRVGINPNSFSFK
ncbi:YncE family protein [Butyricimonas synergistica]|uniref:YncE family protein n=1 Tax=Butyricimonas synergistica TaxID=544644 RepID=UPI000380FDD0|nr:DUF5074 domain-containing protein [Butyricimonas synergistica]